MVENGSNISEIAMDLNSDRKTVKEYLKSKIVPRYRKRKPREGKIDPFKEYVRGRINTYDLSSVSIFEAPTSKQESIINSITTKPS